MENFTNESLVIIHPIVHISADCVVYLPLVYLFSLAPLPITHYTHPEHKRILKLRGICKSKSEEMVGLL